MKPILKFAPYLGIFLLSFLLFRQCEKTSQLDQNRESTQEFLNDTVSYFQNELGQEIAHKTALQGDKEVLEILLSTQVDSTGQLKRLVEKYKKISAAGNIITITKFDTLFIPYSGLASDPEHDFKISNPFYKISGRDLSSGIQIHHLEIPNTLSFAIGKKKTGFWKSEYRIEAVNSNPFVKITGLDSYTFQVPKKRIGISVYAGYGISSNFTFAPQIGVGVSYSLLEF